MNKEVERIMHEVVNLEDAERAKLGRQALERLYRNLRKQDYHKDRIANIVINITRMFVSADKDCAVKEYGFFKEATRLDVSYREFFHATQFGDKEAFVKAMVNNIKEEFDEDTKTAVVLYGIALTASDDTITSDEYSLFQKILEDE